jgi:hypothetical protein
MSIRLPYETQAGYVSEAHTLEQLGEHLRLAEECCYTLSHLAKANDNIPRGDGLLKAGQGLAKMRDLILTLSTSHTVIQ